MISLRAFLLILLCSHCLFVSTLRTSCGQVDEVVVPQTPQAWRQAAQSDIEASYRILADNHPGMVDPHNPSFPKLLDEARQNAMSLASRVDGPAGYMHAIARFSATLQDGHAGPFARLPEEVDPPSRWPGFLTTWRGDGLWVHHSEQSEVPVGARILRCDDQSVDTLMRERVFAFQHGLDQPGRWWIHGRNLLLDHGNPLLEPLRRCEIQTSDGKRRQVTLQWRLLPDSAYDLMRSVTNGDKLPVGLQWREDRWPWIAMPTFQPNASEVQAYDDLVQAIESQRERLLAAPAIVLDLRHNQGGSTQWSVRVASALWGADRVARRREALYAKTQTLWRASPENTIYVESLYDKLKEAGLSERLPEIRRVGEGMRNALAKGEPFFNEDAQDDTESTPSVQDASQDLDSDPPPLTIPVFVIVPPQCASAGLDAIDTFKLFPNTRLVGAPSSADSTYMEVRLQDLPSGLGQVIVPNKVYVNRPRGNGVYYNPDILHRDLDWSTEAFLKRVQAEVVDKRAAIPATAPMSESERTKVMVLGTDHLAEIEGGVPADALNDLLGAIEAYRPDVIAVESLPGSEIARLTRSATADPEGAEAAILSAFAQTTSEVGLQAQAALGLSFESARSKAALLLKKSPEGTEARRVLILHLLAAYDLPSAVLQWSYLAEDERRAMGSLNDTMVQFLDAQIKSSNEIFSVAVAGARQLGLQRLASIDDHTDDEEMVRAGTLDRLGEELAVNEQVVAFMESEFVKKTNEFKDRTQKYRWLNSAEYASRDIAEQWHLFFRTRLPSGLDRTRVAMWEARNLAIAARIRAESASHPGGKVLVLIGASHRLFIEAYLATMMDVRIVPLTQILGGTAPPQSR